MTIQTAIYLRTALILVSHAYNLNQSYTPISLVASYKSYHIVEIIFHPVGSEGSYAAYLVNHADGINVTNILRDDNRGSAMG